MDWKKYENEIGEHFRMAYPEAQIIQNAHIRGKKSGRSRQIDLLIQGQVADYTYTIIVEERRHTRKIDVSAIEAFIGKIIDVGAHKGVMVAYKGYTKAALKRAIEADLDVCLDIFNFDELQEFQGFRAIPYAGETGVVLDTPLGWVVDARQRIGFHGNSAICWMYQRGRTIEEAWQSGEVMYVNFWKKTGEVGDIEALDQYQRRYMTTKAPLSCISLLNERVRTDF